jgi:cytochrome c oxidase assembly factor CtaG
VIIANATLLATHAPWTVDTLRASQIGSFALDAIWLFAGIAMWLPVISPLPEHRVASPRCGARTCSALMKVGAVPVIWLVIAVIWVRWANAERDSGVAHAPRPSGGRPPT